MKTVLVTGSAGLIGSEAVLFFDQLGWQIVGIDNNMRADFFGKDGDTTHNLQRIQGLAKHYTHYAVDIRDRQGIGQIIKTEAPHLIIHCAAQPSHDLAKSRPFDDFDINAVGTLNLLEAVRQHCSESPFILMSTNKVYGDAPNERALVEQSTRWDYANPADFNGIDESCRIDATLHSLFGASKAAADLLVQEYGRYFNMPTVCLRGGCLTGSNHAAAELHGFLAYLARAVREARPYRIYGYKGKQVRDNIHAYDVCTFFFEFYKNPRAGAVYNIGGGRNNSVSIIEAISALEELLGKTLQTTFIDENRIGDHICYISDLTRIQHDYPTWRITRSLANIIHELAGVA